MITNRISIELTGKGNAVRLLKVMGSKGGVFGYFQKMIRFFRHDGPGYYEQLIMKEQYLVKPSHTVEEVEDLIARSRQLLVLLDQDKGELASETRKNDLVLGSSDLMFRAWKQGFSFIDYGVVHSLRKFLHHNDLRRYV